MLDFRSKLLIINARLKAFNRSDEAHRKAAQLYVKFSSSQLTVSVPHLCRWLPFYLTPVFTEGFVNSLKGQETKSRTSKQNYSQSIEITKKKPEICKDLNSHLILVCESYTQSQKAGTKGLIC